MDSTILKVTGINKKFPGTQALTNVDFELRTGEIHSLVGPNGSGKSTLMNIIAGIHQPTSGKMEVAGETVYFSSPSDAFAKGIVMIHQELRLFPKLSVAENVCFGRFPRTKGLRLIDWKAMSEIANEYIGKLSQDISMTALVETLSVAQQQIVEISKALSQDARILIMDEPTASLTMEETKVLFSTVRSLKERGITIVFISHRLDEVLEISDRITVLRDSRLIDTLENSSSLTKDDIVVRMINRDVNVDRIKKSNADRETSVAISVTGLCYENKLNDVSFEGRHGEILGIAGLIGSGRTELFRCIFGIYTSWSGNMEVYGKPFRPRHPRKAVQNRIAYISEDRKSEGLVLLMPIKDNMLFASLRKYTRRVVLNKKKVNQDLGKKADELKLVCSSINSLTSNLSGGNQQKVVVGKWLIANSDIILMDEPTRGIDIGAKDDIYNLAEQLANEGKCVIFVSSELEEVLKVSDRVLVMHEGHIVTELINKDITIDEIMHYATGRHSST